jgi:hypothetical protein
VKPMINVVMILWTVATDSKLAQRLCFQLQQRFLSTGHRIRFGCCYDLMVSLIAVAECSGVCTSDLWSCNLHS